MKVITVNKSVICLIFSQVPLFRGMDDLILDNICDRAKPRVFSKDEKVRNFGIMGTPNVT